MCNSNDFEWSVDNNWRLQPAQAGWGPSMKPVKSSPCGNNRTFMFKAEQLKMSHKTFKNDADQPGLRRP